MVRALAVALSALLLALAAGCTRQPPSVVIVSIDSLRADDAFADAHGRPIAPRLRGLAERSFVFERAYSTAPWTTPAMMGVMTGLPAAAHGVEEHDRALAKAVGTLAERFRAAGYETAAFVPEATLRPEFGFARGFDTYDLESFGHDRVSSPALAGKVLNRLERLLGGKRPQFLWVHLWDPHYNYVPPPPFDTAFEAGERPPSDDLQCLKWTKNAVTPRQAEWLRGRYRGEIGYTDRALGDIVDALARPELDGKVVLAVLGDHGEAFQEHGWLTHTNTVDEEVVHVPLLVHAPGRVAPGRSGAVVSTAQLGRTLLALAGLDGAPFGRLPALTGLGEPATPPPAPLTSTIRQGCYTALVGPRHKVVLDHRTCALAVFDLLADPGERRDLAPGDEALARESRALLRAEVRRWRELGIPRGTMPADAARQAEADLRALGYVGGRREAVPSGCPAAPQGAHDSFGDALAGACPSDGAWACLSQDDRFD